MASNTNEKTYETSDITVSTGIEELPEYAFTGLLIGFGTSYRPGHLHPPGTPLPRGTRCSGCRWTETSIYWSTSDEKYIVHILGKTALTGENTKMRCVWIDHGGDVIDALMVTTHRHNARGMYELPQPNVDALDEASDFDPAIKKSLREWERDTPNGSR